VNRLSSVIDNTALGEPFGQADCEAEVRALKEGYSRLYFGETPFDLAAIKPKTYLIIGRRGSGKTALSQSFSFGDTIRDPISVDVDEPALYQRFLAQLAGNAADSRELAIYRMQRIWFYVVWAVITEQMREMSPQIERACDRSSPARSMSEFISRKLESLSDLFHESGEFNEADLDGVLTDERQGPARQAVLAIAKDRPVIVAIDTLERYDTSDDRLMNALAGLIQCAADFNGRYAEQGLHLKVFMSGEVFPHLKEVVLQNPLKHVKNPVYLLWRPKDLLRLICWRFYCYLQAHQQLDAASRGDVDWTNPSEVRDKIWHPYFGTHLTNGRGLKERTFAYVLRHTQLRPRQLILACNAIASNALEARRFPYFDESDIREAVKQIELDLATEIISSFQTIYPRVNEIVDSLLRIPMVFSGNELDRRAHQSKGAWADDTYSPAAFRQLVTELGIVGRVSRNNAGDGYIDADFEYSMKDRLRVTDQDRCVIHPMFYSRLNVALNKEVRVMPFSTERDHRETIES
jgi:uncharacterized protein with HEPN domain